MAADRLDDDVDQAPDAPVTVAEAPEAAPTQEIPALAADASDAGPTPAQRHPRGARVAATAPQVPDATHPPASQQEDADPPCRARPRPNRRLRHRPSRPPSRRAKCRSSRRRSRSPAAWRRRKPPQAIRYASSAAAEQFGDEDWEAEVDPALAGQVYPVLTSDPDIEVPPHEPGQSQDLEDDAPPFATAPFASVPRLNRVRVSPTPPTEDDDPDEE